MRKFIVCAKDTNTSKEDMFADALDKLEEDFDFAISGIEKLASDGNIDRAIELVQTTSAMINGAIEDIAEDIATAE